MKRLLPIVFLLAALPGTASADFVGVRLGVDLWAHQYNGRAAYGGAYSDLDSDLGLGRSTQVGFFASLEHPLPLIPNIALRYNNVSATGSGTTANNSSFGSIGGGTAVNSKLGLDQWDGILYYELLDNIVSLDAGLDVKIVQGKLRLNSGSNAFARSYTAGFPMVYLATGVALPFTGLSLKAQGGAIAYAGNRLYDVSASIAYESALGLGGSAGYRRENLRIKDLHGINLDAVVQGPFVSLFYHF